jgi:hypothetical protein
MKKQLLSVLIFILAVFFVSCKKESAAKMVTPAPRTVDSIGLKVQRVTTPAAPISPGPYVVWFAMVGNRIYYANPSNTPNTQFMLEYNIASNTFSYKTVNTAVCACGYTSKLISDGTNIFYMGNNAVKYTASSNTWSAIGYPATAKDNNGNTGVVYSTGRIFFLGGNIASTKFKYYDIAANSWFNLADDLFATSSSQLVAINDKIYALGGESTKSGFSSYSPAAGWTTLTNLPFPISSDDYAHLTTTFASRYIIVLSGKKLYIYDTTTDKWSTNPINTGINDYNQNLFSDNINLYIAAKTASNDFALYKIDVNNLP